QIGPYCIVGEDITLEAGVVLVSHVCIAGVTTIGARTRVGPFSSLGGAPQSTGYKGEKTTLVIGADCDIREHVTISTGTVAGGGQTTVGDRNLIMAACHIGHDCVIGNDSVFANNASFGGHCVTGDRVVMGAFSACHQQIRLGQGAMIAAQAGIREDVIPYCIVNRHGFLGGINSIGLKRNGATSADLKEIRRTLQDIFFGDDTFAARKQKAISNPPENPFAAAIVAFLAADAKRPILKFGRKELAGAAGSE
ncbi:MAG: acyl-ACP--UDP-N-acetylglucosamine O-acyltransferase, partial [Notoacmeibacter sp.]